MYGAIIGDIIGSRFEFDRGDKSRDFEFFTPECEFTDDTVMTVAVAEALLEAGKDADEKTVKYKDKLKMLEVYAASEVVENTREWEFLDNSRDPFYIDDVSVYLVSFDRELEKCWVRITDRDERNIIGTLLNEPYQDFGWHVGDEIAFFVQETDDEGIVCISDMIPEKFLTEKDLEDGTMLKEAIAKFNKYFVPISGKRARKDFIDLLEKNGFVSEGKEEGGKESTINSKFPITIDIGRKEYGHIGNITCAAIASKSRKRISADEFLVLYEILNSVVIV